MSACRQNTASGIARRHAESSRVGAASACCNWRRVRCRFADIAPSVRCRFADVAPSVSCSTPTPHQTVSCLRAVLHRSTMQLAPRVDVDITRGQELALVFRCRRAKHRSVAMAEITSWLLQLTTHMQVSCGRVSLCRSLSLFFITVSVYSSVSLSVSLVLGLSLLFSPVLDVCALALSALAAPSLNLFRHADTVVSCPASRAHPLRPLSLPLS